MPHSPAIVRLISEIACRVSRNVNASRPMVDAAASPRPSHSSNRPGPNSWTVLAAEAMTDVWRGPGQVSAGWMTSRSVFASTCDATT